MNLIWKIFIVSMFFNLVPHSTEWLFRFTKRPRFYGHRLPRKLLSPNRKEVQKKIVAYHNYFRANVSPPASNMLALMWNEDAARTAQNWADQCQFLVHSKRYERESSQYGVCGQNIFVSSTQVPWLFAIKTWDSEKQYFTYGAKSNILGVVGHYTQVVWAGTSQVGCGLTKCHKDYARNETKTYFNYVCDYCPSGNIDINRPYKLGKRCAGCPKSCKAKKLCTNFCPVVDKFSNCKSLRRQYRPLCRDKRYKDSCKATCLCRRKIRAFDSI